MDQRPTGMIAPLNPRAPVLTPLLAAAAATMAALYPAQSKHLDAAEVLAAAGAHVLGAWCAGC